MFRRALNSILFRAKWARLGVWFLRSRDFDPSVVKVAGRRIKLSFPSGERQQQEYELGQIYFHDCYRLREVTSAPATIVDIGANVGLFSLVARHHFPRATIHCYEPNRSLAPILERHLDALGVTIFHEAVGAHTGAVQLVSEAGSMYSKVRESTDGGVPMVSLDTVVERCGGSVDLLKLDCEGSEWALLENYAALDHINEITMEFHLWARPGSTTDYLSSLLRRRGFKVVSEKKQQNKSWGLLHAKRESACAA
jgi:FkbM family methyltransferase